MVRLSVTTESQPVAFMNVSVAVVLLAKYVMPFVHVSESHATRLSVEALECTMVKCSVITESQLTEFRMVSVAVVLLAV